MTDVIEFITVGRSFECKINDSANYVPRLLGEGHL